MPPPWNRLSEECENDIMTCVGSTSLCAIGMCGNFELLHCVSDQDKKSAAAARMMVRDSGRLVLRDGEGYHQKGWIGVLVVFIVVDDLVILVTVNLLIAIKAYRILQRRRGVGRTAHLLSNGDSEEIQLEKKTEERRSEISGVGDGR
ncbi:hypothetical protein Q9189_004356 [Teloschistes chrysophthalmus]